MAKKRCSKAPTKRGNSEENAKTRKLLISHKSRGRNQGGREQLKSEDILIRERGGVREDKVRTTFEFGSPTIPATNPRGAGLGFLGKIQKLGKGVCESLNDGKCFYPYRATKQTGGKVVGEIKTGGEKR